MNILLVCPNCGKIVNDAEELINVGESLMCSQCYQEYVTEYEDYLIFINNKESKKDELHNI